MLILDISTRWNSTYCMVKSVIKVHNGLKNWLHIDSQIRNIKLAKLQLSDDEWQKFQSMCDHLKRFEEASRLMLDRSIQHSPL